jgi:hypothetical protein
MDIRIKAARITVETISFVSLSCIIVVIVALRSWLSAGGGLWCFGSKTTIGFLSRQIQAFLPEYDHECPESNCQQVIPLSLFIRKCPRGSSKRLFTSKVARTVSRRGLEIMTCYELQRQLRLRLLLSHLTQTAVSLVRRIPLLHYLLRSLKHCERLSECPKSACAIGRHKMSAPISKTRV